jgi:hypothetical protein
MSHVTNQEYTDFHGKEKKLRRKDAKASSPQNTRKDTEERL